MKKTLFVIAFGLVSFSLTPAFAQVQIINTPEVKSMIRKKSDAPQAVVISAQGMCEAAQDGVKFSELKPGDVLEQGAVIRTGKDSRADLFFRRIGTTIRLQQETEIRMEKLTHAVKDEKAVFHTLLDLKAGRIFTVVRSLVPGCTLEIRNAAGRSIVEGGGGYGRYIITADGTQVADKKSAAPLQLVRDTGITVIAPGQKFDAKEGKALGDTAPPAVEELIDLDEVQSLTDQLTPGLAPKAEDDSEALVLAAGSQATASMKGEAFKRLAVGQVVRQGATLRTGKGTTVDLFLRRWGTTVRLFPESELSIDQLTKNAGHDAPGMESRLNLKEGRMFCFIRVPSANSKFEVTTKKGRSVIDSAGAGRYDIHADGTIVAGNSSFKQIKVYSDHGVTMLEPGQKFNAADGHIKPIAPSDKEMLMMQADQLASLTEQLTVEEEARKQ